MMGLVLSNLLSVVCKLSSDCLPLATPSRTGLLELEDCDSHSDFSLKVLSLRVVFWLATRAGETFFFFIFVVFVKLFSESSKSESESIQHPPPPSLLRLHTMHFRARGMKGWSSSPHSLHLRHLQLEASYIYTRESK